MKTVKTKGQRARSTTCRYRSAFLVELQSSSRFWRGSRPGHRTSRSLSYSSLLVKVRSQGKRGLGCSPWTHELSLRAVQSASRTVPSPSCIPDLFFAPYLQGVGTKIGDSPLKLLNRKRRIVSGPSYKLKLFLTKPIWHLTIHSWETCVTRVLFRLDVVGGEFSLRSSVI
jgi:hypothetical protein